MKLRAVLGGGNGLCRGFWVGTGPRWMLHSAPLVGSREGGPLSSVGLSPCLGRGWLCGWVGQPSQLLQEQDLTWTGLTGGGMWGRLGLGGDYLLEADGQQLSHKVRPFTHGDGSAYEPVVETRKGVLEPSDLPFALPEPLFLLPLGLLAISCRQTVQEFPDLMRPPSWGLPGAASVPGPMLGQASVDRCQPGPKDGPPEHAALTLVPCVATRRHVLLLLSLT